MWHITYARLPARWIKQRRIKMATYISKNNKKAPSVNGISLNAANTTPIIQINYDYPWGLLMIRTILILCLVSFSVIGFYLYQPKALDKTIPMADLTVSGDENSVTGLVINGSDKNNKPFTIMAKNARTPDLNSDVFLEKVQATMTLSSSLPVVITADTAVFNQKEQMLRLISNVVLQKTDERFKLNELNIDLNTQQATSFSGVNATVPMGNITAEGLKISDGGDIITFQGKSQFHNNQNKKNSK